MESVVATSGLRVGAAPRRAGTRRDATQLVKKSSAACPGARCRPAGWRYPAGSAGRRVLGPPAVVRLLRWRSTRAAGLPSSRELDSVS